MLIYTVEHATVANSGVVPRGLVLLQQYSIFGYIADRYPSNYYIEAFVTSPRAYWARRNIAVAVLLTVIAVAR